jgi:hypothetical protein
MAPHLRHTQGPTGTGADSSPTDNVDGGATVKNQRSGKGLETREFPT